MMANMMIKIDPMKTMIIIRIKTPPNCLEDDNYDNYNETILIISQARRNDNDQTILTFLNKKM